MKRLFDITVSFVLIIALLPVFLILSLVVLIDAGHPVIFKQYRVGKDNKLFYVYKFRTMKVDTRNTSTEDLTEAESCITKSGRILRKTSLDEIPQLFNVLTGKMSFVGPRPLIPEEKEIRNLRKEYGVYAVRPGITGWAQVNGRDELEIDVKARLDGEYVRNLTFKMDATCFLMTIGNVLKQKGVVEGGTGAMAPHLEARKEEVKDKEDEKPYGGKNSA